MMGLPVSLAAGALRPWLGAAFLQGGAGTGANGFLNNLRGWLWIPISQSAYRTIALDLFSHVLDLDLKFHLMCVARPRPARLMRGAGLTGVADLGNL